MLEETSSCCLVRGSFFLFLNIVFKSFREAILEILQFEIFFFFNFQVFYFLFFIFLNNFLFC